MTTWQFPPYRPLTGDPYYWQWCLDDWVREAMTAFLDASTGGGPITQEQLAFVQAYFQHWIEAPFWDYAGQTEELETLRETILHCTTLDLLTAWLQAALSIGIDPL